MQELVEKIEQLEEARGQLQQKISLQALPKQSAKPAAMAVTVFPTTDTKSSVMQKVPHRAAMDHLRFMCPKLTKMQS